MNESNKDHYQLDPENTLESLGVDRETGLTSDEVKKRLEKYGTNTFEKGKEKTLWDSFLKQIKNPLVYILFGALVATIFLEEFLDAIVIAIAITLNTVIGMVQEGRASQAFQKLSESQEKFASVIRNNKRSVISTEKLLPGDIVLVEAGSNVPADLRIIESRNLQTDESALTGESKAVSKTSDAITEEAEITEQKNMAFMGTLAVAGSGVGVVTATGNQTEIGKIAKNLATLEAAKTPVQENLESLASLLAKGVVFILAFVILVGVLQDRALGETILISVAIAVSILPEGLPASVTVVLAIGMEAILKKGGLVKNLLAAETLGSTTTILTDKTGTLTQARMSLDEIITTSTIDEESKDDKVDPIDDQDQRSLLLTALRASDAFVTEEEGEIVVKGRPIEKALLEAALKLDISKEKLDKEQKQLDFLPFESKNRFAASLNETPQGEILHISGAPEVLLNSANRIFIDNEDKEITDDIREKFQKRLKSESEKGSRVIAISYKPSSKNELAQYRNEDTEKLLDDSIFVGLITLKDPIREDVPKAVSTALEAGTRVIMLTGDLPETAKSIAVEAGIATEKSQVILGKETTKMEDKELLGVLKNNTVFARVLPDQKLRISELLKQDKEIVAMTGDGVNDAPALRNANIGVAVGSGTEVAKASSDLILLDDSFAIVVSAIAEGRRIISNLKKITSYLLSTNVGECIALVGSLVLAFPLPLLPTQILWVNIIGEGLLNFALAFEPAEKGSMKRSPRIASMRNVLSINVKKLILIVGISTGVILLSLFYFLLQTTLSIEEVRTIMFITLSMGTTLYAFSFKNLTHSIFKTNLFSNRFLIVALFINIFILYLSLTVPALQTLLSLVPLSIDILAIALAASVANLIVIELGKVIVFGRNRAK
ncbi:MAG: HAD-IC family P-type ATPase [Candidatus Campbellbacteria bacterium]|nr:HAD-IC family P-type ATPase [Candidatus Campbellbacteria bacterium]